MTRAIRTIAEAARTALAWAAFPFVLVGYAIFYALVYGFTED